MPNWSPDVPERDGPRSMPLRRTPTSGQLRAVITSPDLIGCNTHFFQGHTMPCSSPDCEACQKGVPWAWHGYLAAIAGGTREHFLFEFTPQVGDIFKEYRGFHGTLRGCIITAVRHNNRSNGRVIVQTKPGDLAAMALPDPPDLEACMAIIWNLNKQTIVKADRLKGHPRIHHDTLEPIADRILEEERKRRNGTGH